MSNQTLERENKILHYALLFHRGGVTTLFSEIRHNDDMLLVHDICQCIMDYYPDDLFIPVIKCMRDYPNSPITKQS